MSRTSKNSFITTPRAAFTLVELCVVVAVLALCVLVFHASAGTRPVSHAARCLNNLRQLMNGWRMYSDDYADTLVANHFGADVNTQTWVGESIDYGANTDATNVNYLLKPFLGPYVKSPSYFKCPEDKSYATFGSTRIPRVRSFSMNAWVGKGTQPITAGYRIYEKVTDVVSPSPANLWVLIDEQEDSINDGFFYITPASYTLYDYPSARHDRAGAISFADGRAELHQWRDPRTSPIVRGTMITSATASPSKQDLTWLFAHTTSH